MCEETPRWGGGVLGSPRGRHCGEAQGWAMCSQWGAGLMGLVGDVGPSCPSTCPPQFPFSTRIFFISSHKSSQGRGMEWGTGHRMLISKGTVHRQTLRVDTHLLIHSCAQGSCPRPWTQGKHLPGSLGLGQRAAGLAVASVWPGHPHPGAPPPPPTSPTAVVSTELPVWVNLFLFFFFFFWGIVLLHDPPRASRTGSCS